MLTIPFSCPLLSHSIFLPMIPLNVRKWLEPRLQASLSSLMMMIRATLMRRVEPIRMDPAKIPLISRFTIVIMSQVSQDQSAQGNFCRLHPLIDRNPNLEVSIAHVWHIFSQHSFRLQLRMNEMHRRQSDYTRLYLLCSAFCHSQIKPISCNKSGCCRLKKVLQKIERLCTFYHIYSNTYATLEGKDWCNF